jgi:hypothetical protein
MPSLKQMLDDLLSETKTELDEKLNLKKGGRKTASANIRKASHDFKKSKAPQFKGKSAKKRHQMAVAAGLSAARGESVEFKVGDKSLYEGKIVTIKEIDIMPNMALIKQQNRQPIFVRKSLLSKPQQLDEGFLGLAPIPPTYTEKRKSDFPKLENLNLSDIGFDIISLREDDDTGHQDRQEEDFDNGSNVRHDGHTGKTEIDNLPTPSDTIAPAYSSEKSPKQISKPLSTAPGYTVAKEPNFDGYDYPADAPEIPTAEFNDCGNARAPDYDGDGHQPHDVNNDDAKEVSESGKHWIQKSGINKPGHKGRLHRALGVPAGKKIPEKKKRAAAHSKDSHIRHMAQQAINMESFIFEMDDLLGDGEDQEPNPGDTITVTMAAMAAILCTVCHKDCNHTILKSMVEALTEVGQGKTIDIDDLDAVAAHMNGEETQEIENREEGRPDHEGIEGMDDNDNEMNDDDMDSENHEDPHNPHNGNPDNNNHEEENDNHHHSSSDSWPGDGEKSNTGRTKLMDDEESTNPMESTWYTDQLIAEDNSMTEEKELKIIKRRAGLKFW